MRHGNLSHGLRERLLRSLSVAMWLRTSPSKPVTAVDNTKCRRDVRVPHRVGQTTRCGLHRHFFFYRHTVETIVSSIQE